MESWRYKGKKKKRERKILTVKEIDVGEWRKNRQKTWKREQREWKERR